MKAILLFLFLGGLAIRSGAQSDSTAIPPFKRFPTLPAFRLLGVDSSTYITRDDLAKKKPVMVMIFSPDCDHCKHETEAIIQHRKDFENIQIVMATPMPFDKMREFYHKYALDRFRNIHVGKDVSYFLPPFYNISNLPFLAFYNRKRELVSVFSGSLPVEKVLEELKK